MRTKIIAALVIFLPMLVASTEMDLGARKIVEKRLFDTYYNRLYWGVSEQYKTMGVPESDHPCIITPIMRELAVCLVDTLTVGGSSVAENYFQWLLEGANELAIRKRINRAHTDEEAAAFFGEYQQAHDSCMTRTFEQHGLEH